MIHLRKLLAGLGLGTLAALFVLGLGVATELLDRVEMTTYDWRMRLAANPDAVNKDIVLVEISDATIREMEPIFGHWPWPRVAVSFVIDYLKRAPAKVIAVDLTLAENDRVLSHDIDGDTWSGKQSDGALTDSTKAAGNVVLLADAVYEGIAAGGSQQLPAWPDPGYRVDARSEPRPVVLPPYKALTDAAAALGHNFLTLDPGGSARRLPPFVRNQDHDLPALGVAAALRAMNVSPAEVAVEGDALRIRDRRVPLVKWRVKNRDGSSRDQWAMLINYRANAGVPDASGALERPYPSYEFRHLFKAEQQLLTGAKPMVDPAVFKDKIVFLGFTASGLVDYFGTPVSGDDASMPGIQLHASVADSIIANRFVRPPSSVSRIASVVITAVAVGMLAAFLPFGASATASISLIGGWTLFAVFAFKSGLWLNLVQPTAAGGLALFFGTAYQYFVEGKEKRKVAKLFGRYVSRDVYAQLMSNPDLAELGGKRRDMTVLFSDIRGFTSVTERGDPQELVGQLNEYFSRMVAIVFRNRGTVDKFVGDMVMALFSAPLDDEAHAEHAVQTAVEMVRELGELNNAWAAKGMPQLDIGIGVNSGDMIAGNIGSSSIMSYTVIGDNVNLGARLESLNKDYKCRIIISDATRARLTSEFDIRPLGDVIVKGKSKAVQIFEVRVPAPLVEVQTT